MTSDEIRTYFRAKNCDELQIEQAAQIAALNELLTFLFKPMALDVHALVADACTKRQLGSRYRATQSSEHGNGSDE